MNFLFIDIFCFMFLVFMYVIFVSIESFSSFWGIIPFSSILVSSCMVNAIATASYDLALLFMTVAFIFIVFGAQINNFFSLFDWSPFVIMV